MGSIYPKALSSSAVEEETGRPHANKLKNGKALLALAIVVGLLAIGSFYFIDAWRGAPSVAIVRPADGDPVEYIDTVEGTVSRLAEDETVWVLVTDEDDNVYHPQVGPAIRLGQDGWRVLGIRFGPGQTEGLGRRYRISTLIAGTQATSALRQYIESSSLTGRFPGLSQFPSGAKLQAMTITVHR